MSFVGPFAGFLGRGCGCAGFAVSVFGKPLDAAFGACSGRGGGRRTPGGRTPGNAWAPRGPRGAWAGGWCRR
eukprot:10462666-Alexandrium_andersonii.AAC.1